jgi:hypothetical protein
VSAYSHGRILPVSFHNAQLYGLQGTFQTGSTKFTAASIRSTFPGLENCEHQQSLGNSQTGKERGTQLSPSPFLEVPVGRSPKGCPQPEFQALREPFRLTSETLPASGTSSNNRRFHHSSRKDVQNAVLAIDRLSCCQPMSVL